MVEFQAQAVDSLERLTYYLLRVNGNELTPPTPIPRPGVAPVEPETVGLAQFGTMMKGPQ